MFFFSLGQGLVEHILVISHEIMVGNYMKRKKWCLMKRWAKLPKVKKKTKNTKTKKIFIYVLEVLCWKSLKSKGVKHWWLKMKNLWALMEYLVWSIIFQNALLSLVWIFPFTFFYLTLTSAPLQPENKTFWFI